MLYLAFYFPPTRGSGVYRARATANYFSDAGWDVTVITPQREFFRDYIHSYEPTLERTVRADINIVRIPFSGDLWEPDIRRYSRLRVYAPRLWRRLWDRRHAREFPEAYAPWINPVLARVRELHDYSPFDVVIATGNPFAAFAIAWRFHQESNVPFVVDYRDPWTLDLFSGRPKYPDRHPAAVWERRILSDAAGILHVNKPLQEWHARRYPNVADRMTVVENGWDPDILGEVSPPRVGERSLRFGYLGTLTPTTPLNELVTGWAIARPEPVVANASAVLYGYLGYFKSASAQLLDRINSASSLGIRYMGSVPKTKVRDIYEAMDVLILAIPGSRYMTAGKVYEYIATGRPIVSVHEPYCAASDTLRNYPLWFPTASLEGADVAAALVAAGNAALTMTPELAAKARDFSLGMTREAQLLPLASTLAKIVEDSASSSRVWSED